MRYLLLLMLLGSLTGCMLIEDALFYDEPAVCGGPAPAAPPATTEPPLLAPAGVPTQTREPPR